MIILAEINMEESGLRMLLPIKSQRGRCKRTNSPSHSQTTDGINPTCWAVTELMRQLNYLIQREEKLSLTDNCPNTV